MGLEHLGSGSAYREELADMLGDLQLLHGFSRSELESMAPHMTAFKAEKNTVLFTEGSHNDAMWFLVEGQVEVVKTNDQDKPCRLTTITAGKSLGEMSVVDGMPYSATAVTVVDSLLIHLTKRDFEAICQTTPKLGVKLLQRLARLMSLRLRQTSGALVQLAES